MLSQLVKRPLGDCSLNAATMPCDFHRGQIGAILEQAEQTVVGDVLSPKVMPLVDDPICCSYLLAQSRARAACEVFIHGTFRGGLEQQQQPLWGDRQELEHPRICGSSLSELVASQFVAKNVAEELCFEMNENKGKRVAAAHEAIRGMYVGK